MVPPSPPGLPRSMAAIVKDPFLEERRELTDGVFGKSQAHFVDVEGRRHGLEHHAEKVPEVFLRRRQETKCGETSSWGGVKEREEIPETACHPL